MRLNKNRKGLLKESIIGLSFTGGAIFLMLLVFAYPLVNVVILAFQREKKFVGFANYESLLSDSVFHTSIRNNFKLLLLVPVILTISLVIAVIIYERPKSWKFHRFAILIPFILPIPVSAIAIAAMVAYRGGLNTFLSEIGLDFLALDWLGQGNSAFFIIAFALVWREIGFCSILIFARLSNIDEEIIEACELDGGGWWRKLRSAIFPQISNVLLTITVLEIITVFFYTFEWIYVLTRGGPAGSTMVVDLYIFQQAVQFRSIGIATAASGLVLIILLSLFLVFRGGHYLTRRAPKKLIQYPKIHENKSEIKRLKKQKNRRPHLIAVKKYFVTGVRQSFIWFFTLIFCLPLYFICVNAFKTKQQYADSPWSLPTHPTFDSFQEAFSRGEIPIWFRNSLVVSLGSVIVITFFAVLSSYYISNGSRRFSSIFRKIFIPLIAIPPIVMIIPLFVLFSNLGLINSFIGAILVFSGLLLPFSCYLLLGFFDSFPKEILEAASVDGSNRLRTLLSVVLPNARPIIGTQLVINLLYVWNSLLIILIFLQGDDRRTLAAGISVFQGRFFRDTPLVMAASLLVILPMLMTYLFMQKSFRKGLLAGAVK